MNDLEIETRIADIEGVHYIETRYEKDNFLALVSENDYCGTPPEMIGKYNPLTDDALCFKFMVKDKICQEITGDDTFRAVICNWKGKPEYYRGVGDTLNRAVCMAKIEAHKDQS